jgi:hypothetical protein
MKRKKREEKNRTFIAHLSNFVQNPPKTKVFLQ